MGRVVILPSLVLRLLKKFSRLLTKLKLEMLLAKLLRMSYHSLIMVRVLRVKPIQPTPMMLLLTSCSVQSRVRIQRSPIWKLLLQRRILLPPQKRLRMLLTQPSARTQLTKKMLRILVLPSLMRFCSS